eukprot:871631-Pyramimonas_sp.AAC.2
MSFVNHAHLRVLVPARPAMRLDQTSGLPRTHPAAQRSIGAKAYSSVNGTGSRGDGTGSRGDGTGSRGD